MFVACSLGLVDAPAIANAIRDAPALTDVDLSSTDVHYWGSATFTVCFPVVEHHVLIAFQ